MKEISELNEKKGNFKEFLGIVGVSYWRVVVFIFWLVKMLSFLLCFSFYMMGVEGRVVGRGEVN